MANVTSRSRQCTGCRFFHRDFNRYFSPEQLEGMEIGYCMRNAPQPGYQKLGTGEDRTFHVVFPLVDEDACCGEFEPGGEE